MAYNAPSTINTGDLITAAKWNADISANPIAIYAGALSVSGQAVGDILYASSTTQFDRVGIGTANKVLTSSGSAPQWSSNIDIGGTLDVSGTLNATGATTLGDTLDVTEATTLGDTLEVTGNVTIKPDDLDVNTAPVLYVLGATPASENPPMVTLEVQSAGGMGPHIYMYHNSPAQGLGDRIGEIKFQANEATTGIKRVFSRFYTQAADVAPGTLDSSFSWSVFSNATDEDDHVVAQLTPAGVWTDASDGADKTWGDTAIEDLFVTDQQTAEDITRGSVGGNVCQRIVRVQDGRYHSARLPEGKTPVWYGGPSAQDFYKEFGLGLNPFTVLADGTPQNHIGIAAKNQAAISWWAIRELCDENILMKARLTALEGG